MQSMWWPLVLYTGSAGLEAYDGMAAKPNRAKQASSEAKRFIRFQSFVPFGTLKAYARVRLENSQIMVTVRDAAVILERACCNVVVMRVERK